MSYVTVCTCIPNVIKISLFSTKSCISVAKTDIGELRILRHTFTGTLFLEIHFPKFCDTLSLELFPVHHAVSLYSE